MILTHKDEFVVRNRPRLHHRGRPSSQHFSLPVLGLLCLLLTSAFSQSAQAQSPAQSPASHISQSRPQLVWVDTDIGDDLDDAFAIALLLRSPQMQIVGISTTFGDTELRARLLDRFLASSHISDLPVFAGAPTTTTNLFTQRDYAEHSPPRVHPDAVTALLAAVHAYGNQLTLLAIGPLFNVASAIERDPVTMHQLRRIVLMGGSIRQGYRTAHGQRTPPAAEWNIAQDPPGAATVFSSGIPLAVFPLDSTQIALRKTDREAIFAAHTPLTHQLHALYAEWQPHSWNHSASPVLFDAVAASAIVEPQLCPTQPMHITITADGMTRSAPGAANARVCLRANQDGFLQLLSSRLAPAKARTP